MIKIPNFIVVWKIFQAIRKYPQFDFFFKNFLIQKPRQWLVLTPEELVSEVNHYTTNTRDLDKEKGVGANVATTHRPRGR